MVCPRLRSPRWCPAPTCIRQRSGPRPRPRTRARLPHSHRSRVAFPPKRDRGGSTTTISRGARPTFRRFAGGGSDLAAPLNEEKRGELSEALADHERGLTTTNPTIGCWHSHCLEAGRKRARTLV